MTLTDKTWLSPNLVRLAYQFWRNQAESTEDKMAFFRVKPPPFAQKQRPRPGQSTGLDVWTRIMRFCDKHGVDALAFVRQQLKPNMCLGDYPAPSQLCDERRIRRYRQTIKTKYILHDLATRGRLAQSSWETGTGHLCSLYGYESFKAASVPALLEMAGHQPLFAYCMALRRCPRKISSDMLQRAVLEYMEFPREYDEAWAKVLPEFFSVKAPLIYVSILADYDQVAKEKCRA